MFELYVGGKTDKSSKFRGLAFLASATVNAGLIGGLLFYSFWQIERVHSKSVPIVFLATAAPPPPPPPAAAPPAPANVAKPKVVKIDKIVQPLPETDKKPEPVETPVVASTGGEGPPDGVPGGDPNGVPGGTGDPGGTGPVETPPPPKNVPIDGVEAMRIAGNRNISLPPAVKAELTAQHKDRLSVAVKLCIDAAGVPDRVDIVGQTGFPEAERKIVEEIHAWRYRPYRVNGVAVPVCSAIAFRYQLE